MESSKVNLGEIRQIPENEFKEHFREWMEQDDVARCLQAKLRKDLISNFNKTALGKKLIAQTTASHRLKLSPLVLAINTLVAEFLYAQNCHFTLSVFCTEVPYRNTLPDFESARHFRFSEQELVEVCDALCSNWWGDTKDEICRQYAADEASSLLFVVLKCLLQRPVEKSPDQGRLEPPDPEISIEHKHEKKLPPDNHQFRYLNKLLIVFLKKVKEMSTNMAVLQAQKIGPQSERKSINMRKLDSLHRSMQKISENLRQMSVTKRKSRNVTTIVSAINAMAKQFDRCAVGFHQASKQKTVEHKESKFETPEKSYNDWIEEMRSTPNGRKFLERVEQSLHKALMRERHKMEEDFQKRLQVQKNILKAKYRQKLSEELAKFTARETADSTQQMSDTLEKRLKEFELKTKEIHEEASSAEPKNKSQRDFLGSLPTPSCNKETQTSLPNKRKPIPPTEDKPTDRSREQESRHADSIVSDAKQRVKELEHESNQLERNIREFLEKQKSEKRIMNASASSILHTYALERSILEKKCAAFRPPLAPVSKVVNSTISPVIDNIPPRHSNADLNINTNLDEPIVPPTFKSAFRAAHKQIVGKNKAHGRAMNESNTNAVRQHFSSVLQLIDRDKDDEISLPSAASRAATKITVVTSSTPRLKIKEMTLGDTESGLSTVVSPSPETADTPSPAGVHKVGQQVFEMMDNGIPSESNGQQMNSNHCEGAESSVKQIINDNGDGDAKKLIGDDEKDAEVNTTATTRAPVKEN